MIGTIPSELGSLPYLEQIYLSDNQLNGSIPPELGSLATLQHLSLSANKLTGAIPPTLGDLTNLQSLYLGWNELSGVIPPELGDLRNLRVLSLGTTHLSGAIPSNLGNLTSLQQLNLDSNQLSGTVPLELGNLVKLQYLYLSNNRLNGALPSTLVVLPVQYFWYDRTDLCEPGDTAFQAWLRSISGLRRTNLICGTHTVSGVIWDDANRDGMQDVGEPGMPGVTMMLAQDAPGVAAVAARQVITESDGQYHFVNVASGAYTIVAVMPGGYLPTQSWSTAIRVPEEGDVTVPPIGIAWAPAHLYLPLTRSR